jgi:hypothetical protein
MVGQWILLLLFCNVGLFQYNNLHEFKIRDISFFFA